MHQHLQLRRLTIIHRTLDLQRLVAKFVELIGDEKIE
jgi:hypothetical protein